MPGPFYRQRRGDAWDPGYVPKPMEGGAVPNPSPRGTYLLIADALRRQIEDGEVEGDTLPSEAALMRQHGVARNTVRKALKRLEADKLIVPVPGSGWRVSSRPIPPLIERLTVIISNESMTVGDVFPSESALCERFGVSRTAVRGALARMEGAGLLTTTRGKGRTVRALPPSAEQS
ncbi:GntR family transcriptional regulator [Streptomyces cinereoruber]|uniref:GntR family transcriptional regulator n=1 Tax=Streptomyces cinereoruber TaxID=67260 RepID=UPI0036652ECE